MSELPKKVRTRTDILDSVGNTTAATGKGFAIASAALTSLALLLRMYVYGIDGINIFKAPVLAMLFVGGMIPVVFCFGMNSVGKAAMDMVYEVRRQFREIPGIMEGTGKPEYAKCVVFLPNGFTRNDVTRNFDYWFSYCYCTSWEASLC
jgi:K(+)-stimulated pyrophosphate-energized sodium pump